MATFKPEVVAKALESISANPEARDRFAVLFSELCEMISSSVTSPTQKTKKSKTSPKEAETSKESKTSSKKEADEFGKWTIESLIKEFNKKIKNKRKASNLTGSELESTLQYCFMNLTADRVTVVTLDTNAKVEAMLKKKDPKKKLFSIAGWEARKSPEPKLSSGLRVLASVSMIAWLKTKLGTPIYEGKLKTEGKTEKKHRKRRSKKGKADKKKTKSEKKVEEKEKEQSASESGTEIDASEISETDASDKEQDEDEDSGYLWDDTHGAYRKGESRFLFTLKDKSYLMFAELFTDEESKEVSAVPLSEDSITEAEERKYKLYHKEMEMEEPPDSDEIAKICMSTETKEESEKEEKEEKEKKDMDEALAALMGKTVNI